MDRKEVTYSSEDFQKVLVTDFTGGMNISDPAAGLSPTEFTQIYNMYYDRQGALYSRPPFRPETFSGSVQSKPITVDFSGTTYVPSEIHDYQIIRSDSTNSRFLYNNEMHVVSGLFVSVPAGSSACMVAVYDVTNEEWYLIKAETAASEIGVCAFKINRAVDLILFPNNSGNDPKRWSSNSPASTVNLGLAAPSDLHYDITGITKDNPAVITVSDDASALVNGDKVLVSGVSEDSDYNRTWTVASTAGTGPTTITTTESSNAYALAGTTGTMHLDGVMSVASAATSTKGLAFNGTYTYVFTYFYDDSNTSTKYGESPSSINHTAVVTGATATDFCKVTVHPFNSVAAGVTKILVYRSPPNEASGPFRYVGTITDLDADWVDTTLVGAEGVEPPDALSNPSGTTKLNLQNVRTVGSYITGFDVTMPYKLMWCVAGMPDVWNPLSYDYLDDDGMVVEEFNRKFYAFTKSSCYQKEAMDDVAFRISNIGCTDGKTLRNVGNGLIWMDYDTVYFADFVQQYGSKGDFPKDIGHPISDSCKRKDSSTIAHAAFFERRYFLTFVDAEDYLSRCYVFDVDVGAWTQHSMSHKALARGDNQLFSIGNSGSTAADYYVYEHDYSATVAIAVGYSDYAGKDYHDYMSISGSTWEDIYTIQSTLRKSTIHFAGEFGKTFISSVSLMVEGSYLDTTITLSGDNDDFHASAAFLGTVLGAAVVDTFIARYATSPQIGGAYADGTLPTGNVAADLTEQGYAGFVSGYLNAHKKIRRIIKSDKITFTWNSDDSRELALLGLALYYKNLPLVA